MVTSDGVEREVDAIIVATGFCDDRAADRRAHHGRRRPQPRRGLGRERHGRLQGHHRPRLPQPVPARRAQHRLRPLQHGLHDRVADRLRARRAAKDAVQRDRHRAAPTRASSTAWNADLQRRLAPHGVERPAAARAGTSTPTAATRPSGRAAPSPCGGCCPASTSSGTSRPPGPTYRPRWGGGSPREDPRRQGRGHHRRRLRDRTGPRPGDGRPRGDSRPQRPRRGRPGGDRRPGAGPVGRGGPHRQARRPGPRGHACLRRGRRPRPGSGQHGGQQRRRRAPRGLRGGVLRGLRVGHGHRLLGRRARHQGVPAAPDRLRGRSRGERLEPVRPDGDARAERPTTRPSSGSAASPRRCASRCWSPGTPSGSPACTPAASAPPSRATPGPPRRTTRRRWRGDFDTRLARMPAERAAEIDRRRGPRRPGPDRRRSGREACSTPSSASSGPATRASSPGWPAAWRPSRPPGQAARTPLTFGSPGTRPGRLPWQHAGQGGVQCLPTPEREDRPTLAGDTAVACASYAPGHQMHYIHQGQALRSPSRRVHRLMVDGDRVATWLLDDGDEIVWHHHDRSRLATCWGSSRRLPRRLPPLPRAAGRPLLVQLYRGRAPRPAGRRGPTRRE